MNDLPVFPPEHDASTAAAVEGDPAPWPFSQPGNWESGICGGSSREEYLGAIQETGVRFSFAALVTVASKRWLGAANSDELGALPRTVCCGEARCPAGLITQTSSVRL